MNFVRKINKVTWGVVSLLDQRACAPGAECTRSLPIARTLHSDAIVAAFAHLVLPKLLLFSSLTNTRRCHMLCSRSGPIDYEVSAPSVGFSMQTILRKEYGKVCTSPSCVRRLEEGYQHNNHGRDSLPLEEMVVATSQHDARTSVPTSRTLKMAEDLLFLGCRIPKLALSRC